MKVDILSRLSGEPVADYRLSLLQVLGQWKQREKSSGVRESKSERPFHLSLPDLSVEQARITEVFTSGKKLSAQTDRSVYARYRRQ